MDHYELKASLVYRVSYRTAGATQRHPVFERKKETDNNSNKKNTAKIYRKFTAYPKKATTSRY